MLVILSIGAIASLGYCVHLSVKLRKAWPIMFGIGTGIMSIWECFVDLFEHIAYPDVGGITLFTFMGRGISILCTLIYFCYFAGFGAWLINKFLNGVNKRFYWTLVVVSIIMCATFEPIIVALGYWDYYGLHPLHFLPLPTHWWFSNALVCVFLPVICALIKKYILTTEKFTWLFLLIPLLVCWCSKGSDIFMYIAFYSWPDDLTALNVAAIVTIAICLMVFIGMSRVTCAEYKTCLLRPGLPVFEKAANDQATNAFRAQANGSYAGDAEE